MVTGDATVRGASLGQEEPRQEEEQEEHPGLGCREHWAPVPGGASRTVHKIASRKNY